MDFLCSSSPPHQTTTYECLTAPIAWNCKPILNTWFRQKDSHSQSQAREKFLHLPQDLNYTPRQLFEQPGLYPMASTAVNCLSWLDTSIPSLILHFQLIGPFSACLSSQVLSVRLMAWLPSRSCHQQPAEAKVHIHNMSCLGQTK